MVVSCVYLAYKHVRSYGAHVGSDKFDDCIVRACKRSSELGAPCAHVLYSQRMSMFLYCLVEL
jgi:hypothetical protein